MGREVREGQYPVLARFRRYVDFRDGENIIGLTDMEGEGGAHTVVLPSLRAGWAERADGLTIGPDAIFFDGRVFPREEVPVYRDSAECVAFAALPPEEKHRRLRVFRSTILRHAAPLSMAVVLDPVRRAHFRGAFAEALLARFLEGASLCAAGAYKQAAALLQGLGYGLTPSGDDFLCGALYALHFAACVPEPRGIRGAGAGAIAEASPLANLTPGVSSGFAAGGVQSVIAQAALAGPPDMQAVRALQDLASALRAGLSQSAGMSRTFLRDAIAGRWPRRLRDAVETMSAGDCARGDNERDGTCAAHYASGAVGASDADAPLRAAVMRVLEHGASSGADLLSGFILLAAHYFGAADSEERAGRGVA
jgi:hypothetical protein